MPGKQFIKKYKGNLILIGSLFLLGAFPVSAQTESENTIKVRKVEQLVKAEYDNTNYKLTAVDRFGNLKENAVQSFEIHYTLRGERHKYISYSNQLTDEMLKNLGKIKEAQEIYFTNIKAEDDNGHLIQLPELPYMHFPDCPKNKKKKSR